MSVHNHDEEIGKRLREQTKQDKASPSGGNPSTDKSQAATQITGEVV